MPTSFSSSLISFFLLLLTSTIATHNRRTLHQPFFPLVSLPPTTQPPLPQPTSPKLPFSSTSTTTTPPPNEQPIFFPTFPSPPPPPPSPPSPSSFISIPANISSLALPHSSKSNSSSSKLVATAIASVLAAAIILFIVIALHIRKRNKHHTFQEDKTQTPDNNVGGNENGPPKMPRSSQTSAEFLYLGTLVNSHSGVVNSQPSSNNNVTVNPRKLDSPELRPLPPLSGQIYHNFYENNDMGSSKDDDFDDFYSPSGSLGGGRESSVGAGNYAYVGTENLETRRLVDGSGSDSYSSSSSGSGSPAQS